MFDLLGLMGNKPWFKSVTAWGLVLWLGFGTMLQQSCGGDPATSLLSFDTCQAITAWTDPIGQALTALGFRKAVVSE